MTLEEGEPQQHLTPSSHANHAQDLVDIGCNLTDWEDGELDEVVERATSAGVRQVIITGTSVKRSRVAIQMAERLGAGIFATARAASPPRTAAR